jgi:hypothetical protein
LEIIEELKTMPHEKFLLILNEHETGDIFNALIKSVPPVTFTIDEVREAVRKAQEEIEDD